ncbi:MAG: UvrD-helicase domain-containing protein [Armatimonadetes bacterium]|nr:UvrD-helicase domain-containing protein [Armatimonadota bacterium]MDE2205192.1 UvrD-helicase domain-containing protein [Armatimonadota bacterium]
MSSSEPTSEPAYTATAEVVYASAGTGKTWSLTQRYRDALERGAEPGAILATTFTRLASAEILNRVLTELATHSATGAEVLTRFCRGADALHVSTIDSFLSAITSAYRYRTGIPYGVRLTDSGSPEVQRLLSTSLTQALASVDRPALADLLAQLEPGRDISAPAAKLVSSVMQMQALYVESGDEAWRQFDAPPVELWRYATVADRLDVASEAAGGNPSLQKLLDKCAAACRSQHPPEPGTETAFNIAAAGTYSRKEVPDEVRAACSDYRDISIAALRFDTAAKTHGLANLLSRLTPVFTEERLSAGLALFEDVTRAAAAIVEAEGAASVWQRMRWSVTHLMLDEFQDTSRLQWRVLLPLARHCMASGAAGGLFVVGDTKQAIYGWRGGCAAIMSTLPEQLLGIQQSHLKKNYRSSQVVLDFVNHIFENLDSNTEFRTLDAETAAAWSSAFRRHVANDASRPGCVVIFESPADGEPEADDGDDETPARCTPHVACVADRVAELRRSHPGATIGVLAQRVKWVRSVVAELHARNIPTTGEGGEQPDEDPAITRVLAMLTLIDHPGDSVCELAVRNSPIADAFGLQADEPLDSWLRGMRRQLVEQGYAATIAMALQRLTANGQLSSAQVERLTLLARAADAFDARGGGRPIEFVREVRHTSFPVQAGSAVRVMTVHAAKGLQFDAVVVADIDRQMPGTLPEAIPIRKDPTGPIIGVTCWPNKQLQADDDTFKKAADDWRAEQVQEGLNNLYVALTRARQCLVLVLPAAGRHRLSGATVVRTGANLPSSAEGMPGDRTIYTSGDLNWTLTRAPEPEVERIAVPQPSFTAGGSHTRRYLPVRSPSMSESATIRGADLFQATGFEGRSHGTAVHAMFSTVKWLDEHSPLDAELVDALAAAGAISGATDDRLPPLLATFRAMLSRPVLAALLSRSSWPPGDDAEVWRERRFTVAGANALTTGVFDRVVVTRRGGRPVKAEILDFKTDLPGADGAARLIALYAGQMAAYQTAAASMLNLAENQVSARLVLVGTGEVVLMPGGDSGGTTS